MRERQVREGMARLFEATSLDDLAGTMVAVTVAAIDADQVGYNEIDDVNHRMLVLMSDPVSHGIYLEREAVFQRLIWQSPLVQHFSAHPFADPATLSDVTDLSRFRDQPLYTDYYRHLDMRDQLALFAGGRIGGCVAMALNRGSAGFSDADREVARRLQGGFRVAHDRLWVRHVLDAMVGDTDPDALLHLLRALGLTGRQADVCYWLLLGKTNPEIGEIMSITAETVKRHSQAVFDKLGVAGRTQAQRAILARVIDASRAPAA